MINKGNLLMPAPNQWGQNGRPDSETPLRRSGESRSRQRRSMRSPNVGGQGAPSRLGR